MEIPVRGGKISISIKENDSLILITASDYGGCDMSPPDSVTIDMTEEEARLVASRLLEVQKELSEKPSLKKSEMGAGQ